VYAFGRTVSAFELELAVDGGALHVFVDGEYCGTYHTPDGEPLAGYIGCASSVGSYKVSSLSVQRLDRSATYAPLAGVPAPILLSEPRVVEFREALNRRVVGMPSSPRGALCAWLALPERDAAGTLDVPRALARMGERVAELERIVTRRGLALLPVLAIPAALGEDLAAQLTAQLVRDLDPEFHARLVVVRHGSADLEPLASVSTVGDRHQNWLLFVDSAGVLRVAETLFASKRLDGALERWVEVFANR
jgi:hypothetical protein